MSPSPNPTAARPRGDGDKYEGAPLAADRQPENRARAWVDGEGYVTRLQLMKKTEDSDFMGFMGKTRAVVDPSIISLPPGYTLNEDGTASKNVVVDHTVIARLTTDHVGLDYTRSNTP